jgi:hypothetical protein
MRATTKGEPGWGQGKQKEGEPPRIGSDTPGSNQLRSNHHHLCPAKTAKEAMPDYLPLHARTSAATDRPTSSQYTTHSPAARRADGALRRRGLALKAPWLTQSALRFGWLWLVLPRRARLWQLGRL